MAVQLSEQMSKTVLKLRRRINDTNTDSPTFSDDLLYGYIQDAVDELESGLFKKGRSVDNGDFLDSSGASVFVSGQEQAIYVLQAAILFTKAIKSSADRDNFSLRKPSLSVDTSNQSDNHAKTIELLEKELMRSISYTVISNSGYRVE